MWALSNRHAEHLRVIVPLSLTSSFHCASFGCARSSPHSQGSARYRRRQEIRDGDGERCEEVCVDWWMGIPSVGGRQSLQTTGPRHSSRQDGLLCLPYAAQGSGLDALHIHSVRSQPEKILKRVSMQSALAVDRSHFAFNHHVSKRRDDVC